VYVPRTERGLGATESALHDGPSVYGSDEAPVQPACPKNVTSPAQLPPCGLLGAHAQLVQPRVSVTPPKNVSGPFASYPAGHDVGIGANEEYTHGDP
jgi:hypothetical protein